MNDLAIDADNTLIIPAGVEVVLDLNGKTLSGETDVTTSNREIFLVKGKMTVQNGNITLIHKGADMSWNSMSTVFDVTSGGVLNIDNATIENLGGTSMNFCAHLNNWGTVTLNISNSELKASYVAVRVFNSGFDMNHVTISNSDLHGDSYALWVHNYIGDLDASKHSDEAIKNRLDFDIFNGTNTLTAGADTLKDKVARFGFSYSVYFDSNGEEVVSQ